MSNLKFSFSRPCALVILHQINLLLKFWCMAFLQHVFWPLQLDAFWGRAKLLCFLFIYFTVSIITRLCLQLELHGVCAVYIKTLAQTSSSCFNFETLELFIICICYYHQLMVIGAQFLNFSSLFLFLYITWMEYKSIYTLKKSFSS